MSIRQKLVGPRSRGQNNRSKQGSGVQQQQPFPQRNAYPEVQEHIRRLLSQKEAFRNQNLELARELNEVKVRLQVSRQNERELERKLIQSDRLVRARSAVALANASTAPASSKSAPGHRSLGVRRRASDKQGGANQTTTTNNEGRQNAKVSQTGFSRDGSSSGKGLDGGLLVREKIEQLPQGSRKARFGKTSKKSRPPSLVIIPISPPSGVRSSREVHRIGEEAPAAKRGVSRMSSVHPSSLVGLHAGRPKYSPVGSAEKLLPPAIQREAKYGPSRYRDHDRNEKEEENLPESDFFKKDPVNEGDDETTWLRFDNGCDPTALGTAALGCSFLKTQYSSPLRSRGTEDPPSPERDSPLQLGSGDTNLRGEVIPSTSFNVNVETGNLAEKGPGKAAEIARSSQPRQSPPLSPSSSPVWSVSAKIIPEESTNLRPRRDVARPLSYQEPSLSIKMRKGHVMFPKAKACFQRDSNPQETRDPTEKKSDGELRSDRGKNQPQT